jgi:hypothetical protein
MRSKRSERDAAAAEGLVRDRLESARRRSFVGRMAELELFGSALAATELPFVVLYVHGPGGVGKTALLHRFGDAAVQTGVQHVHVDGRDVEATPEGFLAAVKAALGTDADPMAALAAAGRTVLLVDTYESLAALDTWFRDHFLPGLSDQVLVTIAGRRPPATAWRTEPGWRDLLRVVALRNLGPAEAVDFLHIAGVSVELHGRVLEFTHGHPLALALVTDVLAQGGHPLGDPAPTPEVVQALLQRFLEAVPTSLHRHALQVCAEARTTTETVLRVALGRDDVVRLFEWLRGLSFVDCGQAGLFPHDLAREVLIADLKWRDPASRGALHGRIQAHAVARLRAATGRRERQKAALDYLFTWRADALHRFYLDWTTMGQAFGEPATPDDRQAILGMVERHEGPASASLAAH